MTGKRARRTERLKTAAIILLTLITLVLVAMILPFFGSGSDPLTTLRELITHVGAAATAEPDETLQTSSGAHVPLRLVWNGGAGRCGYQYGNGDIDTIFQPMATILGEAFGSARNVRESSDYRTRALMKENSLSLYLDYGSEIQTSVLASWYGAEKNAALPDVRVRRIVLAAEGDSTVLCVMGESGIWEAETAVKFSSIVGAMSSLKPNGAAFAFEMDGPYEMIDDYTLLSGRLPQFFIHEVNSPLATEEGQQQLLRALGFNPNTEAQYAETDGTRVVVESGSVLRFSQSGAVSYRGETGGEGPFPLTVGEAATTTPAQVVAWAALLFDRCMEPDPRAVCLRNVAVSGETITATFGYVLDGTPVRLTGDEPAMTVTVTGGVVTRLELRLERFTETEEQVELLPEKLAAAAAGLKQEPVVTYVEEAGRLIPTWLVQ